MRIFSGSANRCVRSLGNPGRRGDSDRKAGRKAARTFATKKAARAAGESPEHLSGRLPCRKSLSHRSAWCDKKSGTSSDVPFRRLGRAIKMVRELQKTPRQLPMKLASTGSNEAM